MLLVGQLASRCGIEFDRKAAQAPDAVEGPPGRRPDPPRVPDPLGDLVKAFLDLRSGDELTEAYVHTHSECQVLPEVGAIGIEPLGMVEGL